MLKKISLSASVLVLSLGLVACSDDGELVELEDKTVVSTDEEVVAEAIELDKITHELVELTIEQRGKTFYLNALNKTDVELDVFPEDVYINDTMGKVAVSNYIVKPEKRLSAQLSLYETEEDFYEDNYADLKTGDVIGFTVSVTDDGFQIDEDIEIEFTVK